MEDFSEATSVTMAAYQQIAGKYGLSGGHITANELASFWREHMQRFVEVVQASPAYRSDPSLPIMDVGCGPGKDALAFARRGLSVLAVDLSEAMLVEARQRTQSQPGAERVTFRQMDMRALDLPAASCAGLWVSASLLHIPKRENLAVLSEFARVLVPGGPIQLLVKEHDGGEDERYDLHEETGTQRFYARYKGSELWDLLERANLRVLEINTTVDTRFSNLPRWLCALALR